MTKASLIFLLVTLALFLAVASPLGFFDGHGGGP